MHSCHARVRSPMTTDPLIPKCRDASPQCRDEARRVFTRPVAGRVAFFLVSGHRGEIKHHSYWC